MIEVKKTGPWVEVPKNLGKHGIGILKIFGEVERDVSEYVLDKVKKRIPAQGEYKRYRDSLTVVQVKGIKSPAIYSSPKAVRISGLDPRTHVLYFRPIPGTTQSAVAKMLINNSPFVIGVLDSVPRTLKVYYRKVSESEVNRAKEKNEAVVNDIIKRIEKESKSPEQIHESSCGGRGCRLCGLREAGYAMPDMDFFAIRMEKGSNGYEKIAHWKPVISRLVIEDALTQSTKLMISEMKKPRSRHQLVKVDQRALSDNLAVKVLGRWTDDIEKR